MNIIFLKVFLRQKKRFISSFLVYFVSVFLILFSVYYNQFNYAKQIEFERSLVGSVNYTIKNNKYISYNDLKSRDFIKKIGVSTYLDSSDTSYKNNINIMSSNKSFFDVNNSRLISGRYPSSTDEIVCENWMLPFIGNPKIGESIKIPLYRGGKVKEYKVSGIVSDVSKNELSGSINVYNVRNDPLINNDTKYMISTDNRKDALKLSNYIKNNIKDKKQYKEETINYLYKESILKSNLDKSIVIGGVTFFIMIGISLIYSKKDEYIYGIMQSIGMTRKSNFRAILFNNIIVSMLAFIFASAISNLSVARILVDKYGMDLLKYSSVSIGGYIFLGLIPIVSSIMLSIVEYNRIRRKTVVDLYRGISSRNYVVKNTNIKNIENKIAFSFIRTYYKKIVVLGIAISVVSSAFIFSNYKANESKKQLNEIFNTSNFNKSQEMNISPLGDMSYGISKDDMKYLESIKLLDGSRLRDKIEKTSEVYARLNIPKQMVKDLSYFKNKGRDSNYEKNILKGVLTNKGDFYNLKITVVGVDENILKKISPNLESNSVVMYIPKNKSGNNILNYKTDDKVEVKVPKNNLIDSNYLSGAKYPLKNVDLKISYITDKKIVNSAMYVSNDYPMIIMPFRLFENKFGIDTYKNVNIYASDEDSISIRNLLNQFVKKYSNLNYVDVTRERMLMKDQVMSESTLAKMISGVVLLICILNLFNLILSEWKERKDIYKIFRVIGCSKFKLEKISFKEVTLIAFSISLFTVILALLEQVYYYNKYVITWTENPKFTVYTSSYLLVVLCIFIFCNLAVYIGLNEGKR